MSKKYLVLALLLSVSMSSAKAMDPWLEPTPEEIVAAIGAHNQMQASTGRPPSDDAFFSGEEGSKPPSCDLVLKHERTEEQKQRELPAGKNHLEEWPIRLQEDDRQLQMSLDHISKERGHTVTLEMLLQESFKNPLSLPQTDRYDRAQRQESYQDNNVYR